MAGTNQYLPFATGLGADVLSPAAWTALAARSSGFGTGTAVSTQLNSAWRQGSTFAAVLGQIIANTDRDALQDDTTAALVTKLLDALAETLPYRLPPGSYLQYSHPTATPPGRFIRANGAVLDRVGTYAALFAVIGTAYNTGGELSTKFRIPDKRGTFDRDLDETRGLDPSRTINSLQAESFKLHGHPYISTTGNDNTDPTGAMALDLNGTITTNPAFTGTPTTALGEQIGGEGGTETRPVNTASRWFIAY